MYATTKEFVKDNFCAWLAAMALLLIGFAPVVFHFLWGNHDWMPLIADNSWGAGLIEGRFSQYILLNLFLMGKILPVLNMVMGFMIYTAALVLLGRVYFGFKIRREIFALFIAVTASLPYMTEIVYFQFIVFSQLCWPFVAVLSLLAAKRAAKERPFFYTLLAAVLLFAVLGGYPPAVNFYLCACFCRLIQSYAGERRRFKEVLYESLPYAVSLVIALCGLKLVFSFLLESGYMMALYNGQLETPMALAAKIFYFLPKVLGSFMRVQPFLGIEFKVTSVMVTAGMVFLVLRKLSGGYAKILGILLLAGLLWGMKFAAFLVAEDAQNVFSVEDPAIYMVRADFYSMPCLLLFSLMFLYEFGGKIERNLTFISGIALLWLGVMADLSFAKTHLLGFRAEGLLLERLSARIEENPRYNSRAFYTVVQAGELPLRQKFYEKEKGEVGGYYTLKVPYFRHWIAFEYYNFFAPEAFVREGTAIRPDEITPQMAHFLMNKITVWPDADALFVNDSYAIMALSSAGRNMLKEQFKLLFLGRGK